MDKIQILDHGYLGKVEHYGSDESIIEAARMSTNKGFRTWEPYEECTVCGTWRLTDSLEDGPCMPQLPDDVAAWTGSTELHKWRAVPRGDFGLLSFLHKKHHSTPFEMAGLIIEVQAPIFVFREWHRHRTQSYNEMSARYTPLPDLNYMPTAERCLVVSGANKQANAIAGADTLTHEKVLAWLEELDGVYKHAEQVYQSGLKMGVPKELARLPVPVARYSRMRANANLRNWLAFLTLRMAPDAQWEIRQYANAVGEVIKSVYPRTWELFIGDAK
jgi:thymidylate synthase (FAD)